MTDMKTLVVEFYGLAREIAHVSEVELELVAEATVREALRVLARSYPGLVGPIIEAGSWTIGPHFLLNLDGKETVDNYEFQPGHGARLLLMSALAGGS